VPFYASALVILSISRFVLSALSAALPRLISGAELVTANAISATAGTIATALGGGLAIVVRSFSGASNDRYAVIAAAAAIPYLAASVVARRFARRALGPTEEERRARSTPAQVVHGLVAGARQIRSTAGVGPALLTIAGHRLAYGIWTVCTLLLYRNHFSDDGFFRAGLAGLGQVLVMVAIGGGAAALVTPSAFRRLGPHRWVAAMLLIAAAFELVLVLPYRKPLAVVAGLVLGFTAQAVKISVDTVIQQRMPDRYRGRVFTIYDMLFNVALVLAASITALFLPEDGHAPAAAVAVGVGWAVLGLGYLRSSPRTTS
jgi:hypothetical protein